MGTVILEFLFVFLLIGAGFSIWGGFLLVKYCKQKYNYNPISLGNLFTLFTGLLFCALSLRLILVSGGSAIGLYSLVLPIGVIGGLIHYNIKRTHPLEGWLIFFVQAGTLIGGIFLLMLISDASRRRRNLT